MKTLLSILFSLCLISNCFADDVIGDISSPPLEVTEIDGTPSTYPYRLVFPNGSVSDELTGATISFGASGDITSVGDVTTGAAFDGTQGTTLTFNNAGGDGVLLYNGEFSFDKNVGIGITNPTEALDVNGVINLESTTTPSTPAANNLKIYSIVTQGHTRPTVLDDDGIEFTLNRDNVFVARNTSGSPMTKGQAVYITGSTGNVPNVSLAKADSLTTLPAVGLLAEDLTNNSYGNVYVLGHLTDFNTSSFSAGDRLYVSTATAGSLQNTRPAYPNYAQRIGSVLVSGVGNGSIHVTIAPFIGGEESGTAAFQVTTLPTAGLKVLANGNVGIGNTNPTVLLEVGSSPNTGLKVLASGKVGIGTTAPAYTLDVSGDIRATGDIYSADQYTVTGDMGALGNLGVGTTTPVLKVDVRGAGTSVFGFVGGSMGIGNTAPQALLDVSATTPGTGLIVLSTGRVGIGLTNPSTALDVSGTVNATALTEGGNAVYNSTEVPGGELGGSWGTPTVDATHSGSAHHASVTLAGTPNYLTLSGQEITLTKLDISDDTNATGGTGITLSANDFSFDATELSALTWSAGGSAQFSWTYNLSGTDPKINFNNNSFNIETGNMGVGNTAPEGLLDVGTTPGKGLIVRNNFKVGIGTTNPAQALDVVGLIKTTDTLPLARLNILNVATGTIPGAALSLTKQFTLDKLTTQNTGGTNAIFTLYGSPASGTGPYYNLSVGQTSTTSVLNVTSFTGGTVPSGHIMLVDINSVSGTVPAMRLEVWGHE